MFKTCFFVVLLLTLPMLAAAGDYDISRDSNTRDGTLREGKVLEGRIINARFVELESSNKAQYTGTAIGAALGALVGNQLGKKNPFLSGSLGGLIGGAAGNMVTDKMMHVTGQELIVERKDGQMVVVTQADSDMQEGELVYIVESAGKKRVIAR